MKIYLAPLEGITGYTYRRALYQCFGGFDKYFIPFILPNQKGNLGGSAKVVIRGARSAFASGNNQPLYVIDGVPMLNSSTAVSYTHLQVQSKHFPSFFHIENCKKQLNTNFLSHSHHFT